MHFIAEEESRSHNVTPDPKIGQTFIWPFLIQEAMENPACFSTPPETIFALLWTTIAVFGIVYALLGYRCLRAIGFLSGLAAGAGCIFWLQNKEVTILGSPADSALAVVTGLFGAVIGSAHPIAAALVSAIAGSLIARTAIAVCIATMPDHVFEEREIIVATGGGAIMFAVLTLLCAKLITIISSSIVGSTMIVSSIDFFMHGLKTVFWVNNIKPNTVTPPPCWGGLLLCTWPVTAIVSIIVQCFITAWRVNHQRRPRRRHPHHTHRSSSSNSRPRETREEARQRKYRYLYQVRTARGDIISQNYVSALQKRIQPGTGPPSEHSTKTSSNERNTLNSDRTHFTNIPDSDIDRMDIVPEKG